MSLQRRGLYPGKPLKKQAQQVSKVLHNLKSLPWKIAILVDSTLQHRVSLNPENAKKLNRGKGFVIGHQWTYIVLIVNDVLIPLRPIALYSRRYCREHKLMYQSEHEYVVTYIEQLNLCVHAVAFPDGTWQKPKSQI